MKSRSQAIVRAREAGFGERTGATAAQTPAIARYAKCIEVSKRVRWDIDRDVIRDRTFDFTRKFLPDRLAQIDAFGIANADEPRFVSQIQGRTSSNMFGLVEHFIGARMLEITRVHARSWKRSVRPPGDSRGVFLRSCRLHLPGGRP